MRTKQTQKRIRTVRRHRLALALVGAMAMPATALAQTLPTGGSVVPDHGTATINYSGNTMTVTQTTKGVIIDWGSFNIGSGYGVTFNQPNANAVALNRVVGFGYGYGPSPSNISGTLASNGTVFLINTAGIMFSGGATINVGGLIATTVDMSNAAFDAGVAGNNYVFDVGGSSADVQNYATINAAAGGTVAFVGQNVTNFGDINAPGGTVAFGAANAATITLDPFGDGLTQLTITQAADADQGRIRNHYNTISADGGQILMRAANVGGGGVASITSTGMLRAQGTASRAGRIELTATGGTVLVGGFPDGFEPGTIDVSGGSFAGGDVVIAAADVGLFGDGSEFSRIDATGGAAGGSVDIRATGSVMLYEGTTIDAGSQAGPGGSIFIGADDSLAAFGSLYARGGNVGGSISTYSGGSFDIRGLRVDAGSSGSAGLWTLWAPNLDVVAGTASSTVLTAVLGDEVQDGDINQALDTGTSVTLRAGTAPADAGDINFAEGVDIFYDDGTVPLQFRADAQGSISGSNFGISSNGAALSMAFNADANNLNNGFAGISFTGANLDSNGGDILFYGQSDTANGVASSYATGLFLGNSTIASNGGNVLLRGASTGIDAGPDDAGVVVQNTSIDAGSGTVTVFGSGEGVTSGVVLGFSDIAAGAGGVTIDGQSADANGLYAYGSDITTSGGDIALTGIGALYGIDFDGDLYSYGGDIVVHGEGGSGDGVDFAGAIDSAGGDIDIYGHSDAAIGLEFGGGYYSGIVSGGGDIALTGIGATGGVALHESSYGSGAILFFAASDVNTVNSSGGDITITGTASAAGAIGVHSDGVDLIGGAGDVTVDGSAPLGTGILLANGAGVSTTTGAIALIGTGATFGLDIADGAIDTDSGDITLTGDAVAATATAGVRVGGAGLSTDGGTITVTGSSAGGIGVQLGDGSTPFAIDSNGGAIGIEGTGVTAGVLMRGNTVDSGGGAVSIAGTGATVGVSLDDGGIDSVGGNIDVTGAASAAGGTGVSLSGTRLSGAAGDVTVDGSAPLGVGVLLANGAGVSTTTGAISLAGTGADFGLDVADGAIDTGSGDISLTGDALAATATAGVRVTGGGLTTNGGAITVTGSAAGGVGVQLGDGGAFAIGSGGGAIGIEGSGVTAGVLMRGNTADSSGGAIEVTGAASGTNGIGVDLADARLIGGSGDVTVFGNAAAGTGVNFAGQSGISTTTGAIGVTGIGATVGLALNGGELTTDSGHFDLRGRGTGAASDGLVIGQGVSIATNGGGIELSGEGGSGAGLSLGGGSSVDAGNSLVVIRAGNDGSSDAIRIGGSIASDMAVNLRPGGVDANGGLTERTADGILVGGGTAGFALSGAELAMIDAPQLVIGSNLHAGAIHVLGAVSRDGDLTLQNEGGSGGIDVQAALDVGDHVLALSSGGDIVQADTGAITAHSLLARAGGDVLLAEANNNVAANTLAGSAGGDFEYQDVDALAIGSVSAIGMDAGANGLSSLGATGIAAGGDVFVRNLAGDMTLNADVSGVNVDLVTANTLQNLAGASIVASGDWRVWANTWAGETRGGLAGDGNLPNLYGCTYLGACGVTVPSADNHFIYVQQPTALVSFDDFNREYGLPNPVFTFTVSGAILGDSAANVATGTGTTTATIGSDVGNYAITGNFTSAAGYLIQFDPGTLAITPATLLFTADSFVRYLGTDNPVFTGGVSGFRNGDTVQSVFGSDVIWSSPAGLLSPIGYYAINGGSSAKNYVFAQAPGNATALQIIPLPQLSSTPIDLIRETVDTYVYDRNFGSAPMCAINASLDDQQLASTGDELSNEWSKVRSRPNLTNCFDTQRRSSCGDF